MTQKIALIGFGEAGFTFAQAGAWGPRASAYDVADARLALATQQGVIACGSLGDALEGAALVLSLVTADQALAVAHQAAALIAPDALFCDMNSVAPGTKREAAQAFAAAGKRYVDVAVMAPVHPACLTVPLNVSGEYAAEAQALLADAGFTRIKLVGDQIGRASAIKLIRSVMVKGLEALTAEMMLAARAENVADDVLASLDSSEKAISWAARADYNLDRILVHGRRRAAEMYEAAQMLQDLNIAPMMTENTVNWQQALGELGINPPPEGLSAKLAAIAAAPAFSTSTKREN